MTKNPKKSATFFLMVTILQKELLLMSYEIRSHTKKYVCTDGGKGDLMEGKQNRTGRRGCWIYSRKDSFRIKYLMTGSQVKIFILPAIVLVHPSG